MCWLEAGRGGSIVGNGSCLAMKILNTTRKSILRLNSEKKRYQQSIKYKKGKRKYKKEINSCHRELPGDKNIEYNPKKKFWKAAIGTNDFTTVFGFGTIGTIVAAWR